MNWIGFRSRLACATMIIAASLTAAGQPAGNAQAAADAQPSETRLKAAFLYKFASYVEWPTRSAPGAPLVIGVMDAEDLIRELSEITTGRSIDDHPIEVRRVEHDDLLDGVQILFIGDERRDQLDTLLRPTRRLPILTVTESRGAISDGSIINFTVERDRVRFEVSLAAAEASRLKLSSRLLSVASRVHRQAD